MCRAAQPCLLVLLLLLHSACLIATCDAVEPPLHTQSRWMVDQSGARVDLACVNWYGAHMQEHVVNGLDAQPVDEIAQSIAKMGFNCVRLVFSLELYFHNPVITNSTVLAANPQLVGRTGMEIFDVVVEALTRSGLMVVLNNHVSKAMWCCSTTDGEGLWHTDEYPESMFQSAWTSLAHRYAGNAWVVGADLRNELREANGVRPTWGSGDPMLTDWAAAATRVGNAVLAVNPNWLIIVEGLDFATNLRDVARHPLQLSIPNRLVYSAHDYSWSQVSPTYSLFEFEMHERFGFIVEEGKDFTAPLWLGEFGTDVPSTWWSWIRQYVAARNISWAYWSVDGEKTLHVDETYGIFMQDYKTIRSPWKLADLQHLMAANGGSDRLRISV